MTAVLMIFIGGGLGSILRYGISQLVKYWSGSTIFPTATLLANVLACILLALVIYVFKTKLNENTILLGVTGFCGGLSTFSTFSFENIELINRQLYGYLVFNVVLSLVLCFGVIWLISKVQH